MIEQREPADVTLKNIRKSFGTVEVLKGVSLKVPAGGVISLIGPSGSGKTTLLRCINCLEVPNDGEVWVGGTRVNLVDTPKGQRKATEAELRLHRRETGMVFQHYNLFPHFTAIENIAYGVRVVRGLKADEAEERAMKLLDRVGLRTKAKNYPSQLSGGQQQRVAIARALALQPRVMLFDEVTSALDPELVGEVLGVIRDLADSGMTMILVTHEMRFAARVCDEVVFMADGKIVEQGSPEKIFDSPETERLETFLGHVTGMF